MVEVSLSLIKINIAENSVALGYDTHNSNAEVHTLQELYCQLLSMNSLNKTEAATCIFSTFRFYPNNLFCSYATYVNFTSTAF